MSAGILEGKVAVITGAGQGIGRGIAQVFVREGAKVILADFSGKEEDVAAELGPSALPFRVDLRDEAGIKAMFAKAVDAFGRLDAIVNNAGTVGGVRDNMDFEYYDRMSQVNLRAVTFSCQYGIQAMLPTGGGSIVNVSSVSSTNMERRTDIVYAACKAGVNSITKSYAVRFGDRGIRVNTVAPGFTLSETNHHLPETIYEEMRVKSPMGRGGSPTELGEVAAFLASDRASYVSGVYIPVDGAWSARMV